jgi:signal transduction histidine kinase
MKIRTKLTYQFTFIVTLIIIAFSLTVYNFSSNYRRDEFRLRLKEKAITTAKLYSKDVKEIDSTLLKIIEKNSSGLLPEENIAIYNYKNTLLFKSSDFVFPLASKKLINKILYAKEIRYTINNKDIVGVLYIDAYHNTYVVIASAHDIYGLNKLNYLKNTLIVGVLIALFLIIMAGLFFSKQVLNPISNIIEQTVEITGSNLSKRINEGNGKDEIAHLTHTFNNMLERIQNAFEIQKNFVANSSHELRTPLTSITGQLEVALMKPREPFEYQKVLKSVLDDIKNLNHLANGLLELAQTQIDISKLDMKRIRIDELLWEARIDLINREPEYKVNIEITDIVDDDQELIVFIDKYLLASAIFNIMENGCKFSYDKQVNITLKSEDNMVHITFLNKGIGIKEEDLKKIGEPFFRGSNAKGIEGHGIGLSLVLKIITQHFGEVFITSTLNEFTEVNVYLPTFRGIIDTVID